MPTVQLSGSGTWEVPAGVTEVKVLLVAGGGGGGSNQGGGGGGGGVVYEPALAVTPGAFLSYAVGNGGSGGPNASRGSGTNGQNTTFDGVTTAVGGGFGSGTTSLAAGNGGCGGGGDLVSAFTGGTGSQGFDGASPGGGGGMTEAGIGLAGGDNENSYKGGDGIDYSSIFGATYGDNGVFGGGGGAGWSSTTVTVANQGGAGGGGNGARQSGSPGGAIVAEAGLPGSGGGGGAGTDTFRAGGAGGSGTILIQWPDPPFRGPWLDFQPSSPAPPTPPAVATDIATTASIEGEQTLLLSPSFTGSEPLTYRWFRNGVLIRTALDPELTIKASPIDNGATYYVTAQNDAGVATSSILTLTVTAPAFVFSTDLPATSTFTAYTYPDLKVAAPSARGATYQWYLVGVGALPDSNSPTLDLGQILEEDSGVQFYVEATDAYGTTITSSTTTLSIVKTSLTDTTTPPAAITPPSDPATRTFTNSWAAMVAAADGGEPFYYDEWQFSGRTFLKRDQLLNPKE